MAAAEIVDSDPSWVDDFEVVAERLADVLGGVARRIDHIGSTSVPGLAAKDVIDVQVTVSDATGLDQAARLLATAGWSPRPDLRHDHELADDPEQWVKRVSCEPPGERRVNVHIRVDGRHNQRYALLFRDYLRAHPQMAAAYGEFKRRAAAVLDDNVTYTNLKDPVCDLVYRPAEEWAARTAWAP